MNGYYFTRKKKPWKTYGIISCIILVVIVSVIGLLLKESKKAINSEEVKAQGPTTAPNTPLPKPVESNVPISPSAKPVPKPNSNNKKDDFSDSVFIGDSRTEGLQLNTGLRSATFLTQRGLTVSSALTTDSFPLSNGKKGTLKKALSEKQYKKVFVMFGVNELGWPYTSTFIEKYGALIKEIQKLQPKATIYVQSIIPVTKEKSEKDSIYNNNKIKTFNKAIVQMTKDMELKFLNVQEAVVNTNKILPSDASTDGIHLKKSYCIKWLDYIKSHI